METMATLFKHSIRPTSMKSGFTKDMTDTDTFGAALDASQTQGLTTGMEGGESKPAYGKTEINSAGNEAMTADILAEPFIEKLIDFLKQTDGKTKTKEIDMDDLSVMLAEMPKQLQDIAAKLFQHDSELSGVPQTELSFQNDLKTKWTELLDSLKVNGRQDSPIDMPMLADSEEAATSGASRVKETVNTHHMQAILEEGKELLSQVAKILQVLDKGGDVNREAQKVLQYLQKWTALDTQSNGQLSGQIADMDGIDERTIKNWQSLVQLFEKRTSMANKQQYLFNSKVSSMDIAKWLGKIGNESKQANTLMEHVSHAAVTSMPMTKVEQYVIHVNQSYQGQPADEQQLMEQLEKIMKSTDLRQLQNGKTELKISLRPQNLGDLTIRMNQVNGEMIVKISVHTSVAKEMIESNLHQLKHMFSPHQVAVEKQDMHILASQSANKEQSDQTFDEQQHSSKDAEDTFQAENDEEDDLKEQFADILLHAKV